MALDNALLESVAEAPTEAILRTYGWSEATVSLGYFQSAAEIEVYPRLKPAPCVRRPTGGGAICHEHELTYALVVPRAWRLAREPALLYRAVHGAVIELLRTHGVPAQRRGAVKEKNQESRPFFCFTDCAAEDIVVDGVKVVGSAQRRRSGAVLQHGSLLLRRSVLAPDLLGLSELVSVMSDSRSWSALVQAVLPGALGLVASPCELSRVEAARSRELESARYRSTSWNWRR